MTHWRVGLAVVAMCFCGASTIQAKPDPAAVRDLSALLGPIRAKAGVPAMGVAIVTMHGVVALGVDGLRAAGHQEPVTRTDRWHLGSCTKAMTATLTARLVEQGKLAWDDTLAKRFPKLKELHADYRDVTLTQLLGHRGGVPAELSADGLDKRLWMRKGTPRAQRMELVRGILPKPPAHKPGSKYLYSNAGYAIVGAAAEDRTDVPWEDLMQREVFTPLGMKSAGQGAPGTYATPGKTAPIDQPRGHRWVEGTWVDMAPSAFADNPPAIGPGGTVHATLVDWGRFIALHLRGARGEETKYLKPATFTKLHTPLDGQPYALGWLVARRPWAKGPILNHAGTNTMWFCTTWVAPSEGFAVIVTCNAGGKVAEGACDQAAWAAIQEARK